LRLRFHTPGQESAESIEPGLFFRLIGGMLCRGAANEPVATWLGDWHLADARFARAEALDPVVLYFESNAGLASSAFGPFEAFHVGGAAGASERAASAGVAAAAGGAAATTLAACAGSRVLARLDERSLLWYPPRAQDGWASVLIAPPGRSRFDLMRERPIESPAARRE
jgi:hypothetical protein